jgi:hypothetical protein
MIARSVALGMVNVYTLPEMLVCGVVLLCYSIMGRSVEV